MPNFITHELQSILVSAYLFHVHLSSSFGGKGNKFNCKMDAEIHRKSEKNNKT